MNILLNWELAEGRLGDFDYDDGDDNDAGDHEQVFGDYADDDADDDGEDNGAGDHEQVFGDYA